VPPQKKEPAPIVMPPSQSAEGASSAATPAAQPEEYELSPLSPMPLMEDEIVAAPAPAQPAAPSIEPVRPPVEQPVSGKPVLKVKTMIEPEEATAQDTILQPMPPVAPVAPPRIVMPQDAPEKAVQSVPAGNRLIIEPFPEKQA
jgi:hypothetical protein